MIDFKALRFDPEHHLGMGDVRLTIAQQDEIEAEIDRLRGLLREVYTKHWPFLTDGLHERVYDAINGAAVQPSEGQEK